MRGHDELDEPVFTSREHARQIVLEHALEGLYIPPLRVLGRERAHAVERERELEVHRLLGPKRAVVVENGDTLRRCDEVSGAFCRDALDESDDGLLRRTVVP
jgi:hypothetical protein